MFQRYHPTGKSGAHRSSLGESAFSRWDVVVVVALVVPLTVLAACLAFRPRPDVNRVVCAARLRDLGLAFSLYINEDDEVRLPRTATFGKPRPSDWSHWQPERNLQQSALAPYLKPFEPDVLRCPLDTNYMTRRYPFSYSMNEHLNRGTYRDCGPSGNILLGEEELPDDGSWQPNNPNNLLTKRHAGAAEVLFADGHAQVVQTDTNDRRYVPAPLMRMEGQKIELRRQVTTPISK